jgi:hypothetical protein
MAVMTTRIINDLIIIFFIYSEFKLSFSDNG